MIELVFFTSSRVKLAHAVYLCRDYAVRVVGYREKTFGATYIEPRIQDREQLIELSYQDALQRWLKAASGDRIFFIEDTSVMIEALSSEREIPGLDVKFWMAETSFESLDKELKALSNNRRAIVRSDLVLHLPTGLGGSEGKGYKSFTSIMSGTVIEHELSFETNPMYPWLDNKTFNKWFVPHGTSKPISMLPISEADLHDFRAPAFREMLEFLESNKKIFRRTQLAVQTSFDFGARLFIVCGPSCAGKTTLAEHLADQYGYYHIEASDFMYLSYYQRHGVTSSIVIGDFAEQALREQPHIVAAQVLHNIEHHEQVPVIVTGFRSMAEVDWFSHFYEGKYTIELVYVTADQEIRYARSLLRRREGEADGWLDFVERDRQQAAMGLLELSERLAHAQIENNQSLDAFFNQFDTRYSQYLEENTKKLILSGKLEELTLLALAEKWEGRKYFTTTEIAQLINQVSSDKPKSKNNISRYFNQTFHPYFEIKLMDGKRRYRLSNTGMGKARLLKQASHAL